MMEATRQTDATALLSSYIAFPDLLFEKQTTNNKNTVEMLFQTDAYKRKTEEGGEEEEGGDII